jgi:hypothetical protein
LLFERFTKRENQCVAAVLALLGPPFKRRHGLPRDVARLIAHQVWTTMRSEVWESSDSLVAWTHERAEWRRLKG